jgi:hypothetical protein
LGLLSVGDSLTRVLRSQRNVDFVYDEVRGTDWCRPYYDGIRKKPDIKGCLFELFIIFKLLFKKYKNYMISKTRWLIKMCFSTADAAEIHIDPPVFFPAASHPATLRSPPRRKPSPPGASSATPVRSSRSLPARRRHSVRGRLRCVSGKHGPQGCRHPRHGHLLPAHLRAAGEAFLFLASCCLLCVTDSRCRCSSTVAPRLGLITGFETSSIVDGGRQVFGGQREN